MEDLYTEIRRAGGPEQVANVLYDAGPEHLRDLTAGRITESGTDPQLRARLIGQTAAKPSHVVWMLEPGDGGADSPIIRAHDYGLHRVEHHYGAAAPCSPEVHAANGQYVERWHNHRYGWFVTMTLSDKGYTEQRINAPLDAELTPGELVLYWRPGPADIARMETREFSYGDMAMVGLNDLHRLRDQCGAMTFLVQGAVEREASTVFDDDFNVLFQPSDFGATRFSGLLGKLQQAELTPDAA